MNASLPYTEQTTAHTPVHSPFRRNTVAKTSRTLTPTSMSARLAPLKSSVGLIGVAAVALLTTACGSPSSAGNEQAVASAKTATAPPARVAGTVVTLRDTIVAGAIDASAVVEPIRQATLSTKLMGTITDVLVHEGDVVHAGQALLHIDARDLTAKSAQVSAGIADAEAMQRDARVQAMRIRALFADSAATRAQLDAVETALARAEAGVRSAHASSSELAAMQSYATVRAPFDAMVTRRLADPGTFAAPGAPLLTVQDVASVRISATVAADGIQRLRRGQTIGVTVDGVTQNAVIEGIVPASAGNLFTINATVANSRGTLRAGSAAVMHVPSAEHHALLVPLASIVREGDLTGVVVHGPERDERRWIRIGIDMGTSVEVTSGLHAGDQIVIPSTSGAVPPPVAPRIAAPSSPSSR